MLKERKAVSPVVGVILMVAATIVIAAIVMGFLGGFNPPKKPLDIQLANGELVVNGNNWSLTFTIAGADAKALKNNDIDITMYNYNSSANNRTLTDISKVKVNITGSLLVISGNNTTLNISPGDRVRVTIKYRPTGQILFDNVLVAREE